SSFSLFLYLLVNTLCVFSGTVYRVTGIKSNSAISIRNGAGTNYGIVGIVGSLKYKDLIYAISVSNGWAKFYKGYVSTTYLKEVTDLVKYETNTFLNCRIGPSTKYTIVKTLNEGTVVNYYGRDPTNKEWTVTDNGYC
ncbi:hypothetical protein U3516DRAFT_862626, partial [Neocallimastix sp. 'constans']